MTELVRTYIERYITGSWSDISSSVVNDIEIEYLISTPNEDTKIASVGRMSLVMNNKTGNFSPNSNFQRGTKIRVRTVYDSVSRTRFTGTIRKLSPDTLEWGDQYVRVDCVDWMQVAVDYPTLTVPLQTDMTVDNAVAYLLTQMSVQPESVTYYAGRETFDFVFNNSTTTTQIYTELSRLALSEFANIYIKAGNVLVVESANTRNGTRTLTQVPKRPSDLHAILTDPNGGLILRDEQTGFAILADEVITPNLATGTIQPINIEIENGDALTNRVTSTTYPASTDASPVLLFQMNFTLKIGTFSTYILEGGYANPNGGEQIPAKDFVLPLVTGTNYVFTNSDNTVDQSTQIQISGSFGAQRFRLYIYNNGVAGVLRQLKIYGIGVYPYNPVTSFAQATDSVTNNGIIEMKIDQKYQDDATTGAQISQIIADDEKDPRNRLLSATFDPSMSPELMQASQYMDSGDLTWITNVKPAMDTYAYIRGKKVVITPAGQVTETWYLKEMDSLRKGLHMIAAKTVATKLAIKQGINFGRAHHISDLSQKTITARYRNDFNFLGTFPPLSKYDGVTGWFFFIFDTGRLYYRENFTPSDGFWITQEGGITGTTSSAWHTVAMSYDNSSPSNSPSFYLDGVKQTTIVSGTPAGTVDTDSNGILTVANVNYPSVDYLYNMWGSLKDVRLYNRLLSDAEHLQIAADHTDYLSVQNGLVFQAPCVKTEDYAGITGTILSATNLLIDNVYGIRGIPNWNFPSGTLFSLKAYNDI